MTLPRRASFRFLQTAPKLPHGYIRHPMMKKAECREKEKLFLVLVGLSINKYQIDSLCLLEVSSLDNTCDFRGAVSIRA